MALSGSNAHEKKEKRLITLAKNDSVAISRHDEKMGLAFSATENDFQNAQLL